MSLKDIAARAAVLTTLAEAIGEELKTAKKELQDGLKAAKEETGTQKISISLDDGQDIGTVSLVQPKAAASITDPDEFLAWVRETRPTEIVTRLVTEVRPSWMALVLKELTAAGVAQWCDKDTGEVHNVPGVELQGRAAYTRMTVPDAGKAAIAEAWRGGRLAGAVPPALAAGAQVQGQEDDDTAKLRVRVAELEERDTWLSALEAAGVDSWEGWDHAVELSNGGAE